jgi:formylglycine-generating enzyme required for sulfatase activity
MFLLVLALPATLFLLYCCGDNQPAVPANQAPLVPLLFSPADGAVGMERTITLTWHRGNDPDGDSLFYSIYLGSSAAWHVPLAANLADTFFSVAGLAFSATYYWKVEASDGTDRTSSVAWSFEVKLYTPPAMSLIPPGYFVDGEGDTARIPASFYLDSTEIIKRDYAEVMDAAAYTGGDSLAPASGLSWYQTVLYCNARSRLASLDTVYSYDVLTDTSALNLACHWERSRYRLPTEDEWELAARAGQQLPYPTSDGAVDCGRGNFYGCGNDGPVAVKNFPANPYGLYDMLGNVWEWCWDWEGTAGRLNGRADYQGEASGSQKILRGGGYSNPAMTSSYRRGTDPAAGLGTVGFRAARKG